MISKIMRKFPCFFAILLSLVLVSNFGLISSASEPEEYYSKWSEYKEKSGKPTGTWNDVVDAMTAVFEHAKTAYANGDAKTAYNSINDGYYGYYETTGFERAAMGYISGARKSQVELQFKACKNATKGGSLEDLEAELEKLVSMLREDAHILDGTTPGEEGGTESEDTSVQESTGEGSGSAAAATATFAACFGIILREGFEAILIVGAIIAYLRKTSGDDKEKRRKLITPVYIGSVSGIVLSFVLAWLLDLMKLANSASQEVIEGITALAAAVVLGYVSNWMISKSESEVWQKYIQDKAEKGAKSGSTIALAITAFLAVFREGAEVVLFFQPMLSGNNIDMVWAGMIVGFIMLIFVYVAIHVLSVSIPLRPLFTVTSILMAFMCISFVGAGVKEFIEGDVMSMTSPSWLSWIPLNSEFLDVLGIYPILETLIPQLIVLVFFIILFRIQDKKNRLIRVEIEARAKQEALEKEAKEKKAKDEELRTLITQIVKEVLAEKAQ